MAKTGKRNVWLTTIIVAVVVTQLVVLGYIVAETFDAGNRARAQEQQQRERRQSFERPVARPVQIDQQRHVTPVVHKVNPKPVRKAKPEGPRAEPPEFSTPGGVFTEPVTVTLKAAGANALIRYTLDGSEPGEGSPLYDKPIQINSTALLRAATFQSGVAPSMSISQTYTMIDGELDRFTSNLPIVVINPFNQRIDSDEYVSASVRFIKPSGERTKLTGAADYDGRTDIKRRGHSSLRFPKASFTLKFRNDDGDKVKAPLYGLPSDSDWVLYAPFVDKSMIRDVLGYELGTATGQYAPRTRFVEVFVQRRTGKLTYSDYAGVYVLVEKITRGKERVNVAKLKPEDNAEPEITGGYILKRDHGSHRGNRRGYAPRAPNDGVGFSTPRGLHLFFVEPDEEDLSDPQKKWVKKFITDFERVLHSENWRDPKEGYARYLDVDAYIDHFLLVESTKNIDGFRYSAYFHIPRGGKITMGPAWDWNLSFGNAETYECYDPKGWYYENLRTTEISWIYRLKNDPEFMARVAKRWAELRRGPYATDKVLKRIDEHAAQLREAQARNFRKWPILGRAIEPNYFVEPTWEAEINRVKVWTRDRFAWLDRNLKVPAEKK